MMDARESGSAAVSREQARCVVCGATGGRVLCRKRDHELLACPCGGVYLSPVPDLEAVDPTLDPHPRSFYALPAAMKLRWLRRSHGTGTLLEVGCGEGDFLAAAKAFGYRAAGVEARPERAARVAARLGIEVEAAMIESSRWPEHSCDIVYHCDLLSHFPDPDLALRKMARLLRPGGVLFFDVGIVGGLSRIWYQWLPEESVPRHRWHFSEGALRALLAHAGLSIVRLRRFGLAPDVLLYRAASRVYQTLKSVRRAASGTGRHGAGPARAAGRQEERPLRAWLQNFMRFRVGAIAPRVGPQTLLVIARPDRAMA